MKAPVKPVKPVKPYAPNKEQKVHKHSTDITEFFIKNIYYDDDGNEITEAQWEAGNEDGNSYAYDCETKELTPSIKDLLKVLAAPPGTNTDDIYIDLSLGYDSSRNYDCRPFQSASIFYTTPFDYKEELVKYNLKLAQYDLDAVDYNKKIIQYKIEFAKYQEYKEKLRLEKKKANLKAQLAALDKKAKDE